jgi:hypothetical protein
MPNTTGAPIIISNTVLNHRISRSLCVVVSGTGSWLLAGAAIRVQ